MLNIETVINRFCLLAGLNATQGEQARPLCVAACNNIDSLTAPTASSTDERLVSAAAAMANYQWALKFSSNESTALSDMKAGDITAKTDLKQYVLSAEKLRDDALKNALPLLKDKSFFFQEVSVFDS